MSTLFAFVVTDDGSVGETDTPIRVSAHDLAAFDALPFGITRQSVVMLDLDTDAHVRVRREHCGADCFCAASAEYLWDLA